MGSAVECFDDAGAVVVPRERFAPVKTTNDLFALRSDAYKVSERSSNFAHLQHRGRFTSFVEVMLAPALLNPRDVSDLLSRFRQCRAATVGFPAPNAAGPL